MYKRNRNPWAAALVACALLLRAAICHAQQVTVAPDHADGVYNAGQPITFRVEAKGQGAPATVTYSLKKGGRTEASGGTLMLTDGVGTIEAKLDEPGSVLAEIRWGEGRRQRALAGAVASPRRIQPAAPRPADFDAFWETKIKELHAVPANPQLEPAEVAKPGVDYWKITLDNVRGSHIRGQLARPKQGEKFPALLIVQWAGVYPLQKGWVTDRAAEGWLALNINAHDLPIDEPAAFYAEQSRTALKDYPSIGNDDRETSYFLRMYLSCYRAAQYLAERPDWDGRTLVVTGTSQGGQQTLVTAGIHPKITAALALVPAGCDLRGPDAGRAPGWPQWYFNTRDKDAEKVHRSGEYYDAVNFAPRITCPLLVGIGLIDETCPPAGVLAAVNQAKGPTEVVLLPRGNHQGNPGNTHAAYVARWTAWLADLRQGKPATQPAQ